MNCMLGKTCVKIKRVSFCIAASVMATSCHFICDCLLLYYQSSWGITSQNHLCKLSSENSFLSQKVGPGGGLAYIYIYMCVFFILHIYLYINIIDIIICYICFFIYYIYFLY